MGGEGSGRYPAKQYKSTRQLVRRLNACTPKAVRNLRRYLDPKPETNKDGTELPLSDLAEKLRYDSTIWLLEKVGGKPRQEVAVMSQERVQIDIRILGPDGKVMELPEDGAIDVEGRELTDG